MPTNAPLQTALLQLDKSSPKFADQLRDILRRRDFEEQISSLQTTTDLMEVIDYLDKALDKLDPAGTTYRQVLRKLQGICTSRMRIPSSHVLPSRLLQINKDHIASGRFSDVFRGTFRGIGVCVKRLRVAATSSPERLEKGHTHHAPMLYREAVIWKRLKHANVVPFTGVTFAPLQIVSEWMLGRDLIAYIKSKPQTSRSTLLVDVAEGLSYLHECDVVHGDLKGGNIVVGADGRARITDFGLSQDQGAVEESGSTSGGTAQWTAPEILQGRGAPSKRADVFSFAMVMVQTFTGATPFDLLLSITAALAIMRGDRPERPIHPEFTHGLWGLMQHCWSQEPQSRPTMFAVLDVLHGRRPIFHQRTFSAPSRPYPNHRQGNIRASGHRTMSLVPTPTPAALKQPRGLRDLGNDGGGMRRLHSQFSSRHPPRTIKTRDCGQLWKGVTSAIDKAQAVQTLAKILADPRGRVFVSRLNDKDAEFCIEILDRGIAEYNLKPAEKQSFFVTLRRLAERHELLPNRMVVKEKIEVRDTILASGGFSDIRCGIYTGRLVAVKTARVTPWDNLQRIRKQFCKEVVLWSTLSHPNVMRLVGVYGDMRKGQFITVSEWMPHGNIMEYIGKNSTNRLELLHGAARGLRYLHSVHLAHGDLKGTNILMSNDAPPRACLADFGFMTTVLNPIQPMACSAQLEGGTMAFMSPELLVPQEFGKKSAVPTPQADIYAFGLVTFQVLTGETPFHDVPPSALGYFVVRGKRPDKPENALAIGLSDSLWDFTQRCWDGKVELRPEVGEVVMRLGEAAASWDGLMPPCPRAGDVASDPEESELDSGGPNPFPSSLTDTPESYKPPLNHSPVRTHHPLSLLNHHWKHPRGSSPNRRSHSTAPLGRQRLTRLASAANSGHRRQPFIPLFDAPRPYPTVYNCLAYATGLWASLHDGKTAWFSR